MTGAPSSSFNPRAHAGRDITHLIALSSFCRFNPRAHAGRDKKPEKFM